MSILFKRILAYIIDSLIISFIILSPFNSIINKDIEIKSFQEFLSYMQSTLNTEFFIITLIMAVITLAYWTILEYKFQQTLGKVILNLQVKSRKKLTLMQALIRNISKISTIVLIIDSIPLLKKENNQRYLERMSKTYVVEVKHE